MKALKDCEWRIKIIYRSDFQTWKYYWMVGLDVAQLAGIDTSFYGKMFKKRQGAKLNWERFAKLNGIKNWKFV